MFWSIKNSGEVLSKLKSRGFRETSLYTYDYLYTTLPHYLINEKVMLSILRLFENDSINRISHDEAPLVELGFPFNELIFLGNPKKTKTDSSIFFLSGSSSVKVHR